MRLTGKVIGSGSTLPSAHVMVNDSSSNGVVTNMDGTYSIDVAPTDLLTASFIGFHNKTIKASDVCSQNSCNFDFTLVEGGTTLDEVVITAVANGNKPPCDKKCKTKKILIASGIGVAVILMGILIYKKLKK